VRAASAMEQRRAPFLFFVFFQPASPSVLDLAVIRHPITIDSNPMGGPTGSDVGFNQVVMGWGGVVCT
jgi:hypothetical protein